MKKAKNNNLTSHAVLISIVIWVAEKKFKLINLAFFNRFILIIALFIQAPSKAPGSFAVTSMTSTSITANWQLPPADSRHGEITGYKLFYKRRNLAGSNITVVNIQGGATLAKTVSELDKYTQYEFHLLAVNGAGDGPKGLVEVARTKEDGKILP